MLSYWKSQFKTRSLHALYKKIYNLFFSGTDIRLNSSCLRPFTVNKIVNQKIVFAKNN